MAEEVAVDFGQVKKFIHAVVALKRFVDAVHAFSVRTDEFLLELLIAHGFDLAVLSIRTEAKTSGFERTQRLLEGLFKAASNRHGFTHGLHLRSECGIRCRELFKGEAGNLGDYVVECRLEAARRCTRDVVLDLIQRVANSQQRRDLRDREAGGL